MITADIIEVQKDSTYIFKTFKENKDTAIVPTTAFITITDSAGNSILASTAMTIDPTTGLCSYSWDSSEIDVGLNYIVRYVLDSDNPITRLFDIFLYPFTNRVTDDDLVTEYDDLVTGSWDASNEAQSGTATTLVDSSRFEDNNYWKGGAIEVFVDDDIFTRKITGFSSATHTITFEPALAEAVATNKYVIRKSFQDSIDNAGNKVCLDFKKINKRTSLIIDVNAVKYLIIYKFFEEFFFKLMKSNEDEYAIKYIKYRDTYKNEMAGLSLAYDTSGDGAIGEGEDNKKVGQVRWHR